MDKLRACRVCLNHEDDLFQLREYTDQFYEVTGIRLFFDAVMCPDCIGRLHEAHAFREQAICADNTLRQLAGEEKQSPIVVKPKKLPEPTNEEPSIEAGAEFEPEATFIEKEPLANLSLEKQDDSKSQTNGSENKIKRKHVRPKEADEFKIRGCPYCFDKNYQNCTLTVLKQHINTHIVENGGLECDHCNRKFKSKRSINRHLYRVLRAGSNKFRPLASKYECRYCSKLCFSISELNEHLKESHEVYQDYSGVGDKLDCRFCGKTYKSKMLLRSHLKMHDKSKLYRCSVCGKGFYVLANFKTHLETHGEPKYNCQYCGKIYRQRQGLREHLRTHTGERKTCTCDICGKNFTARRSLLRHLKKTHRQYF